MRWSTAQCAVMVSFAGSLVLGIAPASGQSTCNCGISGIVHLQHLAAAPITSRDQELLVDATSISSNLGLFDIQVNPRSSLAANPAALSAFGRAAARWEAWISDSITIIIDADVGPNSPSGSAFPAGVLGVTSQSLFSANFDAVRGTMVADSLNENTNGIVAKLPIAEDFNANLPQPSGRPRTLSGNIGFTAANAKALGIGLPTAPTAPDATIFFNSNFTFDYDSSNGIAPGATDFESVAAHEIGHALGFVSFVDQIAGTPTLNGSTEVTPTTLDLFRFPTSGQPASEANFTSFARELRPGVEAAFDDLVNEHRVSVGLNTLEFPAGSGTDNRQASHWKDNSFTGVLVGMMDPTLAANQVFPLTPADLRALDLMGYEINIPEPGTVGLLALATVSVLCRRRRSVAGA